MRLPALSLVLARCCWYGCNYADAVADVVISGRVRIWYSTMQEDASVQFGVGSLGRDPVDDRFLS